MYFANTTDKRGRKRQHAIAETRDAAIAIVFKLDPKAQTCSTSRGHIQSDGRLFDTGSAMLWHQRRDLDHD